MSKLTLVLKKLKEYDVPVQLIDEESKIIHSSNFVVVVEEDGSLDVAFHVSTPPDEAAITCLILKEVPGFSTGNKIKVGESYLQNKDGTCIFGEEAENKFERMRQNVIITSYIKEQKQMEYIMNDKNCFHA